MNIWHDCLLTGIYTLPPIHCGPGQTTGAVDLPVARDAATIPRFFARHIVKRG
jgi:CRISPR-associated protein Cmr4